MVSRTRVALLAGVIACANIFAACSNGSDGIVVAPQVPTSLESTVSTSISAAAGAVASISPTVALHDAAGVGIAKIYVHFAVTGGGKVANDSAATDVNGIASAGSWTLGTSLGAQTVTATTSELPVVTFTATATAGTPASITSLGGNGGSGVINASLALYASLPSVQVSDAFGNPVAGIPITFTPSTNSGTVSGGVVVTNAAGIATITDWILGSVSTQSLTATSTALPGVQVVFTVSAIVTAFDITVRYVDGPPSARQQLAVTRAVQKWKSVINGSSGTSKVVMAAGGCGRSWMPAINETVTNVLILAKIGTIDGVGKILGNASTCVLHSSGSQLPVLGTMYFDSEDLATLESNGLVDAVILHEMGHVLGIGSLWPAKSEISGAGGSDPIFTGTTGLAQFALIGGTTYSGRPVPVENLGGSGTADVHWRESVFHNELMTGYLNNGTNPMSRVTVGSLADLGYSVNYSGADSFTIAASLLASPFETAVHLQNDVVATDVFTTDMQGRRGVPRTRTH